MTHITCYLQIKNENINNIFNEDDYPYGVFVFLAEQYGIRKPIVLQTVKPKIDNNKCFKKINVY